MTLVNSSQTPVERSVHHYAWEWQGRQVKATYEIWGDGSPVLLLPAFSTVSTREELYGIAEQLAPHFKAIILDWIGFGQSDRLPLNYQTDLYRQFLHDFVHDQVATPIPVIAAGHAAGYVMALAQHQPQIWSKIMLLAPTWQGPLTTMGAPNAIATAVRNAVRSPLLGQFLYKLNTTPAFLRLMYRRHVYVDESNLTPEFIAHKYQLTQQPGARFAPAAFVTGALDPADNRDDFLHGFKTFPGDILVVIADAAPPSSKAEMEAIAQCPHVDIKHLPGSLGLYEEFADDIANWARPFLMDSM